MERYRGPTVGLRTWFAILALVLARPCFAQQRWERIYGDTAYGYEARFACRKPSGGYVVVGSREDPGTYAPHVFLMTTDECGDTLWTRSYFGTQFSEGVFVVPSADGGYYVVARTLSDSGYYDARLMKTDASGNLLWSHVYTDPLYSICVSCCQPTSDGGFVIGGNVGYG